MEFEIWHLWILAAILFFLLEIFIPSFLMASIGIGCIMAFLGALINAPLTIQLVFFIIGTLSGFLSIKPVMQKYAYRTKVLKTNASGLIGRIGKVIDEINEEKNTGWVAIDGDLWKSVPSGNEIIPVGEKVKVLSIDSIVLTVERLNPELHRDHQEKDVQVKNTDERLTIRVGKKTFFVGFSEIAFIYSSSKITYLVTIANKQYIHDKSLENLNDILPAEMFYRANRQFIVTRNVISEMKADQNGKLVVSLNVSNGFPNRISVSRLKAAAFREWLKKG